MISTQINIKQQKNRKTYLLLMCIICFVLLIYGAFFLINGKHFTFLVDQYYQYDVFYEHFYKLIQESIKEKVLPMYSWYDFLGNNYLGSKVYYCVGDIFNPILFILYCFGINISVLLRFEFIVCILISAFTMALYLRSINIKNQKIVISFSIIYAFCGCASVFYGQYMFHRFYAFLPVLFFAIERYLITNNGLLLSMIVCILLIQNYYLMVPISISLIFYCIYAFKRRNKFNFIIIFKCILYYLLGALLSSFLIIPAFMVVINNLRIGKSDTLGIIHGNFAFNIKTYLELILNSIINIPSGISTLSMPVQYYHLNVYSNFVSVIPLVISFTVFVRKPKKYYPFIILFVLSLIPITNSFIHGFSGPSFRWTFIIDIFFIFISAEYLDKYFNKKEIKKGFIFCSLIYIFAIIFSIISGFIKITDQYFIWIIISFVISTIILFTLLFSYTKALIMSTVFVVLMSFVRSYIDSSNFMLYQEDYFGKEYLNYIDDLESDELYRMYIEPNVYGNYQISRFNKSLYYDFMGVQAYDTFIDPSLQTFLYSIDSISNIIDIDSQEIRRLLGVKYYIVYDDDKYLNDDYEFVQKLNNYKVYRDKKSNDVIYIINNLDLNKLVLTELTDKKDAINNNVDIFEKGVNSFSCLVNNENDCTLLITIPNNPGWKILVDEEMVEYKNCCGGFIGLDITGGEHIIKGYYVTPGLKIGLICSGIAVLFFVTVISKKKILKNLK